VHVQTSLGPRMKRAQPELHGMQNAAPTCHACDRLHATMVVLSRHHAHHGHSGWRPITTNAFALCAFRMHDALIAANLTRSQA